MTTLPPGWTLYSDGFWPPDGSRIDVLHPDGSVSVGMLYRHWDLILCPPLYGPLGRTVVGWRLANTR